MGSVIVNDRLSVADIVDGRVQRPPGDEEREQNDEEAGTTRCHRPHRHTIGRLLAPVNDRGFDTPGPLQLSFDRHAA